MPGADWTIQKDGPNSHAIRWAPHNKRRDWEAWLFLSSDHHWDSVRCDRTLLERHLALCAERNAPHVAVGDIFDAMGSARDPRGHKEGLRPELWSDRYRDELWRQAADWYEGKPLDVCFYGNHETSMLRHGEVDVLYSLTAALQDRSKSESPYLSGYQGFIRLCFSQRGGTHGTKTVRLFCFHGLSGGPVSKGAIEYARLAEQVDSDIYFCGHIHRRNHFDERRWRCNQAGRVYQSRVTMLRGGAYKNDVGEKGMGWAVEKRLGPRARGGWFLRFFINETDELDYEVREPVA